MNMRKTFAMACGIAATITQAIELKNPCAIFGELFVIQQNIYNHVLQFQQEKIEELTENCPEWAYSTIETLPLWGERVDDDEINFWWPTQ